MEDWKKEWWKRAGILYGVALLVLIVVEILLRNTPGSTYKIIAAITILVMLVPIRFALLYERRVMYCKRCKNPMGRVAMKKGEPDEGEGFFCKNCIADFEAGNYDEKK
jgi:hypothetical protein